MQSRLSLCSDYFKVPEPVVHWPDGLQSNTLLHFWQGRRNLQVNWPRRFKMTEAPLLATKLMFQMRRVWKSPLTKSKSGLEQSAQLPFSMLAVAHFRSLFYGNPRAI